jgi:glycosyltransferase involved in cell wall biosynthesis
VRITIFTPEYRGFGGGIMSYYRHLAPALARAGCTVRVIEGSAQFTGEKRDRDLVDGVAVETLELARLRRWEARFSKLKQVPVLRSALAASYAMGEQAAEVSDFEIIEAADFGLLCVAPVLASMIPCVLQLHGSSGQIGVHDSLQGRELDAILALAIETEVLSLAGEVQTYSEANAAYWTRQADRKVCCFLPAWAPAAPSFHSGISNRLAVFGRVQRWKGPQILCEALRRLGSSAPHGDWYGRDMPREKPDRSTSLWLSETFPDIWGQKLHHHPPVSPEEVRMIQASALLNVVPSTWDVFNFTVVEAMASGRPVICSNGAGASELIADGATGFIYEGSDPSELAAAIDRALSLPPERLAAIGKAARAHVTDILDPDRIAKERIQAYEAICKRVPVAAVPPDWLQQLCKEQETGGGKGELEFLDDHPLRDISAHAARRIWKKVLGA